MVANVFEFAAGADPTLRPLFRDFLQGVLKHMRVWESPCGTTKTTQVTGLSNCRDTRFEAIVSDENDWSWSSQFDHRVAHPFHIPL